MKKMEVNELMIGDKVVAKRIECVGDGGQYQEWNEFGEIIRIFEDTVYVMFDKQKDDWEEIDIKYIEPIHLSIEILEKNGFKKDEKDKNMYYWNWSICNNCISYDKETGKIRIFHSLGNLVFVLPLRYVHKLQHALKLCEIEKEIIL